MMRHALSMLGGIALAVGLFWMLALLVAPPEQQVDEPIMTMSMTMVEAPEVAPEQEAPPPAPAQISTEVSLLLCGKFSLLVRIPMIS